LNEFTDEAFGSSVTGGLHFCQPHHDQSLWRVSSSVTPAGAGVKR
jgi:hypothetical protein